MSRTTIEIDDDLLRKARKLMGIWLKPWRHHWGIFRIGLTLLLATSVSLFAQERSRSQPPNPDKTTKGGATVSAGISKQELEDEARVKARIKEGIQALKTSKYDNAGAEFVSAIHLANQVGDEKVKNALRDEALGFLGQACIMMREYGRAESTYLERLALEQKYLQFDSSVAGTMQVLGQLNAAQSRWDKAEDYYQRSSAYLEGCIDHYKHSDSFEANDIVANNDRRQKSVLLNYLAVAEANGGKTELAANTFEQAYVLGQRFRTPPTSLLPIVENAIAMLRATGPNKTLNAWLEREQKLRANSEAAEK